MDIGFEQGNLGRHCPMVPMMPCDEDGLRAILGQVGRWSALFVCMSARVHMISVCVVHPI